MLLTEKTRNQLVSDSKKGKRERDGKTRFDKRLKSRIGSSVREYNALNMDKFFKQDILDVNIQVYGETDNYIVTLSFGGILNDLKKHIENKEKIELRDIVISLTNAFNKDNVYIWCSCPDWQYRIAYYATKKDINAGAAEIRPSLITNPNDDLGDACKHVLLVLSNTAWVIKVARVVSNYINYIKDNKPKMYADIIYPAIYGKKYKEPVQLDMFDDDTLDSETSDIDKSNEYARKKGQFTKDNPYRIKPSDTIKNQTQFDDFEDEEVIEDDGR